MDLANKLIKLEEMDEYIKTGTGGEYLIDLHGWLMYIPLGNEKYLALIKAEKLRYPYFS